MIYSLIQASFAQQFQDSVAFCSQVLDLVFQGTFYTFLDPLIIELAARKLLYHSFNHNWIKLFTHRCTYLIYALLRPHLRDYSARNFKGTALHQAINIDIQNPTKEGI